MGLLDAPAPGVPADDPAALVRPDDLVGALGRFLARLHGSTLTDAGSAPTETPVLDVAAALATASARVAAGDVDPESFDPAYRGQHPERLLQVATDLAAGLSAVDPVPVHGDLTLGGLLLDEGRVVGWPPVAVERRGDPYVDLVAVARGLAAAVGPGAVPALFDAAGVTAPDPVRIEVWALLGQLVPRP